MSLNVNDDYVEVWCVPSATHVQCKQRSRNNVLDISAFVILLFFFFLRSFVDLQSAKHIG